MAVSAAFASSYIEVFFGPEYQDNNTPTREEGDRRVGAQTTRFSLRYIFFRSNTRQQQQQQRMHYICLPAKQTPTQPIREDALPYRSETG